MIDRTIAKKARGWRLTCSAFTVRVEVGQDLRRRKLGPSQPRPDEADPLLLPDDLDLRVDLHVVLQLLLQVGCEEKHQQMIRSSL